MHFNCTFRISFLPVLTLNTDVVVYCWLVVTADGSTIDTSCKGTSGSKTGCLFGTED